MSLIRWRNRPMQGMWPIDPSFARLPRQMDRLFEQFLGEPLGWNNEEIFPMMKELTADGAWAPVIDIDENETEILVRAELPGIESKDIDVSISENNLIISGEKREHKEEKGENSYYAERRFGMFRRTITLPQNVNVNAVTADCTNGVLTVHVPRTEPAKRRQIEVKPTAGKTESRSPATSSTQPAPATKRVPVGTM